MLQISAACGAIRLKYLGLAEKVTQEEHKDE
jgi:hypothetical protein